MQNACYEMVSSIFLEKRKVEQLFFFLGNACCHVDDVDTLQMMWGSIFIIFFFLLLFLNACCHIDACGSVANVRGQSLYIFYECMLACRCMLRIFFFFFLNAC